MAKQNLVATMIDEALSMREQINALTTAEEELRKRILAALKETNTEIVETARASAKIRRTTVAQIDDEAEFFFWTQEPGNGDCLKIGVIGDAWRARVKSGVKVPGVTPFVREALVIAKQHKLGDA